MADPVPADWAEVEAGRICRDTWDGDNFVVTTKTEHAIATALRAARENALEEVERSIGAFAKECVGNAKADGTRDPFVYEQGIGAERCVQIVHSLKSPSSANTQVSVPERKDGV